MTTTRRRARPRPAALPAVPDLRDEEGIVGFLERVADANFTTVQELTGRHAHAVLWEDPPEDLLRRVEHLTGYPVDRLRRATLRDAYPGAVLSRARTGRRYVRAPARCTGCHVATVGARLNLIVVCPACGAPLRDSATPPDVVFPSTTERISREISLVLRLAGENVPDARERLTRLEALMVHLEPALWDDWPRVLDSEDADTRFHVVAMERAFLRSDYCYVRPPYITATLLHLTWDVSGDPRWTQEALDDYVAVADAAAPAPGDVPEWSDDTSLQHARQLLLRLGIRPEHIPTLLRLPGDPVSLPRHIAPYRIAEALALLHLTLSVTTGTNPTWAQVREIHGAQCSPQVARIARHIVDHPYAVRRLAWHAQRLHAEGLTDLRRLRLQLAGLRRAPVHILEQLPAPARDTKDLAHLAAAWAWLDATRGRLAGGPHPNLSGQALNEFDTRLNPEGRLYLRAWWQHHLNDLDNAATATACSTPQESNGQERVAS